MKLTREQIDAQYNCLKDVQNRIESYADNYDINKFELMAEVVAFLNRQIAAALKKQTQEEDEDDDFVLPDEIQL